MALRIRRGTDAERQSITPKLGELLYVTDTGLIYVGDGTTQGGNRVSRTIQDDESPTLSANLDLNGNDIVGNGNINIDGNITATGNINIGDGVEDNVIVGGTISSDLIPTQDSAFDLGSENFRWQNGHFTGMFVDGNVYAGSLSVGDILAQDSTVLYDTETQTFEANFKGSLFGDDSSPIVNAETGNIFATDIDADLVSSDIVGSVFANDDTLLLSSLTKELFIDTIDSSNLNVVQADEGSTFVNIVGNEDRGVLRLVRFSNNDVSESGLAHGSVFFERNDANGAVATGVIAGLDDALLFTSDSTGAFTNDEQFFKFTETGLFGIGTQNPQNTLDVRGEVVASGYMQFGTYTTTERDSLSVSNGAVIYNSTDNKFQGFQAGSWINLDDGSAA